jgi:glutathione S-transferase
MPQLYVMSGTCALAPNIAAAWLDAPVEIVALARGDHRKPDYLAINPKGQVPAVRFEDGDVLTEAAAILAWLARNMVTRAMPAIPSSVGARRRHCPT